MSYTIYNTSTGTEDKKCLIAYFTLISTYRKVNIFLALIQEHLLQSKSVHNIKKCIYVMYTWMEHVQVNTNEWNVCKEEIHINGIFL